MKIASYKKIVLLPNGISLFGKLYVPLDANTSEYVFIIPGISQLGTNRYTALQKFLAHNSILSFSYDYQGIGESEGNIKKTTFLQLIENTKYLLKLFLKEYKNIYVIGYSIGGYISLRILSNLIDIKGLILISPPVFSKKADNYYLDDNSRLYIKQKLQVNFSNIFNDLKKYKKNSLILFGNKDEKIDKKVINKYNLLESNKTKNIVINNGTHALLNDKTAEEKKAKEDLFNNILNFIIK